MTLPVVFRRRVTNDLSAAFDWYEAQQPGLDDEFLYDVRAIFESIQSYPEMFAFARGEVRRAVLFRFPFAVFYVVEPTRAVVLRVLHTARDPKLWPSVKPKPR